MGRFLEVEKPRQAALKTTSQYFSSGARADGVCRGKPRPFCLPRVLAAENLFPEIRQIITSYFAAKEIKWHDGQDGNPSNHLCDSQGCCANFLFPFADKPQALTELLRLVFPTIRQMLPMEEVGQFVSFEWIGQRNYLGEKVPRHGKRTRGANFTSADAAVMFEHQDGLRQIALIEWKYTESYSSTSLKISKSGTDRTAIYAHLYGREDFPLDKRLLPSFDALFYEPFYQLFRQQTLAHEMEREQELGAEIVSLLHIAPAHNGDFRRVTSPVLRTVGDTVPDVWRKLVKKSDRFRSVSTEELFGRFPIARFPELAAWWKYTTERYSWMKAAVWNGGVRLTTR
ncbi:MAG: hypothetical protein H8D78_12405 [Chloroflexi bacterium]|nr:hypothetical protein [Chloroflexota bacterium]